MDVKIKVPESMPSACEDKLTQKEEKDWSNEDKKADVINKIIDRYLKIFFAIAVFLIVSYWAYRVLEIVLLQGYRTNDFHLSDPVLITLLSTISINIFGYLLVVLKYLFGHKKEK